MRAWNKPAKLALSAAMLALANFGIIDTAGAGETIWRFDNVSQIGRFKVVSEGQPNIIDSPIGKALKFNGKDESLFISGRPLVGAKTFTIEVIFRPDGGAFQQRFMHIAETDPKTGLDALPDGTSDPNPRFMFEVRIVGNSWYLDAFVNSKSGSKPLAFPAKLHPIGLWYAVEQTYDGKTYRSYVNGILEGEADVAFTPHGNGHVRVGARMNRIDHFNGAIAEARFTDLALSPAQFLVVPH